MESAATLASAAITHLRASLRAHLSSVWAWILIVLALTFYGLSLALVPQRAQQAASGGSAQTGWFGLGMILMICAIGLWSSHRRGTRSPVEDSVLAPSALPGLPIPLTLRAILGGTVFWLVSLAPVTWFIGVRASSPGTIAARCGLDAAHVGTGELLWCELMLAGSLSLPAALGMAVPARGFKTRLLVLAGVITFEGVALQAGWAASAPSWIAGAVLTSAAVVLILRASRVDSPATQRLTAVVEEALGTLASTAPRGSLAPLLGSLTVQAIVCAAAGGLLGLTRFLWIGAFGEETYGVIGMAVVVGCVALASLLREIRGDPWRVATGSGLVVGPRDAPKLWSRAWEGLPVDRERLARELILQQLTLSTGIVAGGLSFLVTVGWVSAVPNVVLLGVVATLAGVPVVLLEPARFVPRRWLWAATCLAWIGMWSVIVGGIGHGMGADPHAIRTLLQGLTIPAAVAGAWWSRDLLLPWLFRRRGGVSGP